MSILRSLVKNTVARSVTELVNRLGAALFWVIVARQLGATALGTLAFGLSLFNFFITISTLGLGAVVVRDVARQKEQAGLYLSHTLYIVTVSSILTAACMIGVTLLISPNPDTTFASLVMAAAVIPASGFFVGRSLLFAAEDMAKVTFCRLGENLVKIVGGLLLIKFNAGVRELAILIAISKALPFFIIIPFVYRFARPVWCIRTNLLRYLVSMIPSFSLISIFNSLFWTAPVVILTRISGEYQAGLFSAAYKLIDITVSFAHGYGQALFPIAARTLQHEQTLFKTMFIKSIKYVTILTLALAAGMMILSEEIIRFFYGSAMVEAQGALQILAWMIVPFAVVPILSSTLVSSDLQRIDLKANAVSAVAVT
ncbi:MAG: flippase, partial [Calditrichaeota bacterium]